MKIKFNSFYYDCDFILIQSSETTLETTLRNKQKRNNNKKI